LKPYLGLGCICLGLILSVPAVAHPMPPTSPPDGDAETCERSIILDIREIDYRTKPYDKMLVPLMAAVDAGVARVDLTFASARVHPEIGDLQAAALKYVQGLMLGRGYDPALIRRQEVMLPRSFAGKDELYRLIVTFGPKASAASC